MIGYHTLYRSPAVAGSLTLRLTLTRVNFFEICFRVKLTLTGLILRFVENFNLTVPMRF